MTLKTLSVRGLTFSPHSVAYSVMGVPMRSRIHRKQAKQEIMEPEKRLQADNQALNNRTDRLEVGRTLKQTAEQLTVIMLCNN